MKAHITASFAALDVASAPAPSWFDQMSQLLQMSSITWPLDVNFGAWQADLQEKRAAMSHKGLEQNFTNALGSDGDGKDLDKFWAIADVSRSCLGLSLDSSMCAQVESVMCRAVRFMVNEGLDNLEIRQASLGLVNELVRWMQGKPVWATAIQHLQACAALLAFNLNDDNNKQDATSLQRMRKALPEVTNASQSTQSYVGIPTDCGADVTRLLRSTSTDYSNYNQQVLETAKASALGHFQSSLRDLKALQFLDGANVWYHKAGKSPSLPALHKIAMDLGFLGIPYEQYLDKISVAQAAMKEYRAAMSDIGDSDTTTLDSDASNTIVRATAIVTTSKLLQLAAESKLQPGPLASEIQKAILPLRAVGVKEKAHLPDSLYKWALAVVTSQTTSARRGGGAPQSGQSSCGSRA